MSEVPVASWCPRSEHNAMELFEVPCRVDLWFHGSYGDQASVREDDEQAAIAFEFNPDERERVIDALSELLSLMKESPKP